MAAISPCKSDIGNSKKTNCRFISGFPFQSSNFPEKGGSQASPPFLSHSYRPFSLKQPPLPPLLPLPAANHHRRAATNGFYSSPDDRKIYKTTRTRDSSRTPNGKKAKSCNYPKKVSSNNNVSTVSKKYRAEHCENFSGSVTFAISPPPSSLPLPTFSLRPNLSRMAEAAGIEY